MKKQIRFSTKEHLSIVFEIYRLIPYHFKTTTNDILNQLAEKGVHRDIRTIQRNLNVLVDLRMVEKDDRSKPFGYQNIIYTNLSITPKDALIFQLAHEHLPYLMPTSITKALHSRFEDARLSLFPQDNNTKERQWLSKVITDLPPITISRDQEAFQKISTALYHNHWLTLHLMDVAPLYAMPLGLIRHPTTIELVVGQYIHEHLEIQLIAIETIEKVNLSTFTFKYPKTFNVRTHWKQHLTLKESTQ